MPLIDRLEGFSNTESGYISGIQAPNAETLRFVFSKPVTTGLLEYLALPYLGFFCEADFNSDGSWRDKKKVTSSAAFKIDNWSGQGPVTLKLRDDWFKSVANPPSSMTIHTLPMEQIKAPQRRGFVFSFLLDQKDVPEHYQVVHMLPTIFHGIVLSDKKNLWLKDKNNRQLLRDEIKRQQEKMPVPIASATPVNNIYPHMSLPLKKVDKKIGKAKGVVKTPFEILTSENPSKPAKYMLELTTRALDALRIPYAFITTSQGQHDLMDTFRNPTKYDVRPSSVDSGGGIENQLIKFMFCSNLGISFLDPSKRICALVEEYELMYGDLVPHETMERYIQKFDTIIEEDASIVPIMKTGHSWLLSPDLSKDAVSPTMGIPYFDLMNINE